MPGRTCTVSFQGVSGGRQSIDVEADTLYEAVVIAVAASAKTSGAGPSATERRSTSKSGSRATRHSVTLGQVQKWLGSGGGSPYEVSKKAKLKMMLVQR
jgi:hypothetical protein